MGRVLCIMMNPLTGQRGVSCSIPGPATVSRTPAHPNPLPCILAALRASQRHDLSGGGERVLPVFPVPLWCVLWLLLRDLGLSYSFTLPRRPVPPAVPPAPLRGFLGLSRDPAPALPLHRLPGAVLRCGLGYLVIRGSYQMVSR